MKILFAHRKPRPYGNFSIENHFQTLSPFLEKQSEVERWQAPFFRIASCRTLLLDPYSVNNIKEGFQKLNADEALRTELLAAGYENHTRFDPAMIAGQYLKIYQSFFPKKK